MQRFVDTYLDGEFAESDRRELEAHLAACEPCRRRVQTQAEWKVAIKAAAPREPAPSALRARVMARLPSEPAREKLPPWRFWAGRVLPASTAAGILAMLVLSRLQWSGVAADVVAKHRRNLPLEAIGSSEQVKRWYADKVDFPVRPPSFAAAPRVQLRGGRLADIHDRQAAYLVYDLDGNRVSVFIFDPGRLPPFGVAARQERIGNREVYFDRERGTNVALYRDQGVGYAITSDLDEDQMVKLVSSAVAPR
jgi:mycothiol system anti-sigma-R factor